MQQRRSSGGPRVALAAVTSAAALGIGVFGVALPAFAADGVTADNGTVAEPGQVDRVAVGTTPVDGEVVAPKVNDPQPIPQFTEEEYAQNVKRAEEALARQAQAGQADAGTTPVDPAAGTTPVDGEVVAPKVNDPQPIPQFTEEEYAQNVKRAEEALARQAAAGQAAGAEQASVSTGNDGAALTAAGSQLAELAQTSSEAVGEAVVEADATPKLAETGADASTLVVGVSAAALAGLGGVLTVRAARARKAAR